MTHVSFRSSLLALSLLAGCAAETAEAPPQAVDGSSLSFLDVESDHPAAAEIQAMVAQGIVRGDGDGNFRPDDELTRAEMAAIFARAFDITPTPVAPEDLPFTDIEDSWAVDTIVAVEARGLMVGFPDDTFQPEGTLTRQQAWTAVANAYQLDHAPDTGVVLASFADQTRVAEWALQAAANAEQSGLFNRELLSYGGAVNALRPNDSATRAEVASLFFRALDRELIKIENGTEGDLTGLAVTPADGGYHASNVLVGNRLATGQRVYMHRYLDESSCNFVVHAWNATATQTLAVDLCAANTITVSGTDAALELTAY